MRRVTMLLAAMAVMVTLFAAAAYAVTIQGTDKGEYIDESNLNDTIYGRGGDDNINAVVFSNPAADADKLYGHKGSDTIYSNDGDDRDTLNGGGGFDACYGDPGDRVVKCEKTL
jgi:Ca2+-binding RTX toxin-like protein